MREQPGTGNHLIRTLAAALLLAVSLVLSSGAVFAASRATVYEGVDYARVYSYDYFVKKYPDISKKLGYSEKRILRYFVVTGMKKQMRGSRTFSVKSYRNGNPDLRRKYVYNYRKYYLHYMNYGYKSKARRATAVGVTRMKNPVTVYKGKDYAKVYDYFYYVKHYPDVVQTCGDDDLKVLTHFVERGMKEGREGRAPGGTSGSGYDDGKISVTITSVKITGSSDVLVKAKTSGASGIRIGLFPRVPYANGIGSAKPAATARSSSSITFTIPLNKNSSKSVLQDKFYIGAQRRDGTWRVCSNYFYIQNPGACAANTAAFPKPARGTKKGLKMVIGSDAYINKAIELRCSHVIADFPIETFLGGSGVSYTYEGKVYHFSSAIRDYQRQLKKLRDAGIVVTGVFYLSGRNMTRYMMPAAASADRSGSLIFGINTKNSARKELEALFSCLADYFTRDGALLANWIFGNESNQYKVYNFCGNISYSQYIKDYADQFRLFNTAVKSRWRNARTYMCFDHNWNLSFDLAGSYRGKGMLSAVNLHLKKHGAVHWDLALHPYPSPEQDARFWNRSSLVSFSGGSQQYTMLNINYIAKYIRATYGNNVRIILPETGYSSVCHGADMESYQAAAVAYSYYIAEFDPRIDMIGIHREMNDSGEVAGGFSLGIFRYSFSDPKPAADVFRYMDTPSWKSHTAKYLRLINNAASWSRLVSGFNSSRFAKK